MEREPLQCANCFVTIAEKTPRAYPSRETAHAGSPHDYALAPVARSGAIAARTTSPQRKHESSHGTAGAARFGMTHPTCCARRILVADDDADMCSIVAAALRADGYDVGIVSDGAMVVEWLDAALESPDEMPEVIITDVRMPTLSGLGVLSALRRARMSVPVIVMTGSADASIRTFATRLGAFAVLKKPFDLDALMTAVTNALALPAYA